MPRKSCVCCKRIVCCCKKRAGQEAGADTWKSLLRDLDTRWQLDSCDLTDASALRALQHAEGKGWVKAIDFGNNQISASILSKIGTLMMDKLPHVEEFNLCDNPCFERAKEFFNKGWGLNKDLWFVKGLQNPGSSEQVASSLHGGPLLSSTAMLPVSSSAAAAGSAASHWHESAGSPAVVVSAKTQSHGAQKVHRTEVEAGNTSSPSQPSEVASTCPVLEEVIEISDSAGTSTESEAKMWSGAETQRGRDADSQSQARGSKMEIMLSELERIKKKPRIGSTARVPLSSTKWSVREEPAVGNAPASPEQQSGRSSMPATVTKLLDPRVGSVVKHEEETPADMEPQQVESHSESIDFDSFGREMLEEVQSSAPAPNPLIARHIRDLCTSSDAGVPIWSTSASGPRQAESKLKSCEVSRQTTPHHTSPEYPLWSAAMNAVVSLIVDGKMEFEEAQDIVEQKYGKKFDFVRHTVQTRVSKNRKIKQNSEQTAPQRSHQEIAECTERQADTQLQDSAAHAHVSGSAGQGIGAPHDEAVDCPVLRHDLVNACNDQEVIIIGLDDGADQEEGPGNHSAEPDRPAQAHDISRYSFKGKMAPSWRSPEHSQWSKAIRKAAALIVDQSMTPSEACDLVDREHGRRFLFRGPTLRTVVYKYRHGKLKSRSDANAEAISPRSQWEANEANSSAGARESNNNADEMVIIEISDDEDEEGAVPSNKLLPRLRRQLKGKLGKPSPKSWGSDEYRQWNTAIRHCTALMLDKGMDADKACVFVDELYGKKFQFSGRTMLDFLYRYHKGLLPKWNFDSPEGIGGITPAHRSSDALEQPCSSSRQDLPPFSSGTSGRPIKRNLFKRLPKLEALNWSWFSDGYAKPRRSDRKTNSLPGMYKEVASETTQEMSKMECVNAWKQGDEIPYLKKFPVSKSQVGVEVPRLPFVIRGGVGSANPGIAQSKVVELLDDTDEIFPVPVDPKQIPGRRYTNYCVLGDGVDYLFKREVVRHEKHDVVEVEGLAVWELVNFGLHDIDGLCTGIYDVLTKGCHKAITVVELRDPKHPAVKDQQPWGVAAYGVIADRDLEAFTVLGEYVGTVAVDEEDDGPEGTKSEKDDRRGNRNRGKTASTIERSEPADADSSAEHWKNTEEGDFFYELALPGLWSEENTEELYLDASKVSNSMAFINDHSGTGHEANAVYLAAWVNKWPIRVVVLTAKVKKGQEVLCSYGEGFWEAVKRKKESRSKRFKAKAGPPIKLEKP